MFEFHPYYLLVVYGVTCSLIHRIRCAPDDIIIMSFSLYIITVADQDTKSSYAKSLLQLLSTHSTLINPTVVQVLKKCDD